MNKTETNKLNIASRRLSRTLGKIEKEIDNIVLVQDKFSTFSPEFHLLSQVKKSLSEASLDHNIVKDRIKTKLNEK